MEQLEVFEAGEGFAFGEAALLYNVRAPRASWQIWQKEGRIDGTNESNIHDSWWFIHIYPQ